MSTDFNKPVVGDAYATVLQEIIDRDVAIAKQFNTSSVTTTNLPSGVVVWDDTAKCWKIWNGSDINTPLASTYTINISGSAPFSGLTGKPTTLSGYGITDGVMSGELQTKLYTAFSTGGTSTAFTLTPAPALGSLSTYHGFTVSFHTASGASPTLAISGLTAKYLKQYDASGAKVAASVAASQISDVIYDGTDYIVMGAVRGVSAIVQVASQATTSGTSKDFTSIPSWVHKINIHFSGFSTNGTSLPIVQIGDSGGIETTGYLGAGASILTGSANYTTGFGLGNSGTAAAIRHGTAILTLQDVAANTWGLLAMLGRSDAAAVDHAAGVKSLSATLDRVRITTVNGTDAFDAGSVSISYE